MPAFADVLYNSLPAIYRQYDTNDKVLYRFLSNFGTELDGINDKAAHFVDLLSPDVCDEMFLPYLAQYMGIEILPGLSTAALRNLIKSAKLVWKMKGTLASIRIYCQALTGWTITVTNVYKNAPVSNSSSYVSNSTMLSWNSADANANHILISCSNAGMDQSVIASKTGMINQSLPKLVPAGVPWIINVIP